MADFLVETGTGIVGANSYVTTDEADDYLSVKPNFSVWEELEEPENYLMWAARLLDQRATFRGSKSVATSGLRWPRVGVCDRDGLAVPYDTIPGAIKEAVIEIAFNLVTQGVDPSVSSASAGGEIKRIKADVVEIEYVEGTARNTTNYFPVGINNILAGLGSLQGGSGSRFGRILRA
jgi:hypothetical protein